MPDIEQFHSCEGPLDWHGLYNSKFKEYVTPEANAHPAKMSLALADKILTHLERLHLIRKGDTIVDFMAGTARTGVIAELHGYRFTGIELESHFIDMIGKNRALLADKLKREPQWNIIQGDARHLSELLNGGSAIVSPPYGDMINSERNSIDTDKIADPRKRGKASPNSQINQRMKYSAIISPSYGMGERIRAFWQYRYTALSRQASAYTRYSAITSPPYSEAQDRARLPVQDGSISDVMARQYDKDIHGRSEAQIGNLPDKVGIVSPPYEGQTYAQDIDFYRKVMIDTKRDPNAPRFQNNLAYGSSANQIGNQSNETYLSAMLHVYAEAYKAGISPLVTVTKNPTRKGHLRRLDLDTASLLQQAGYRIVDYHRAILFRQNAQQTLLGDIRKEVKGQVSFFKRISMLKGNIAADHEDIIFAVKKSDD